MGEGVPAVDARRSRWWRASIAALSIGLLAVVTIIAVTAVRDAGQAPPSAATASRTGALYETWVPPDDMPATGAQRSEEIPGTISGFPARPAGIYLPPAALVEHPPDLPLVVFMTAHPGDTDPSYIGGVLDDLAAQNNGLAPIAIVADQFGTSGGDPACADSTAYGNARSYVTLDVVTWAKENLAVNDDPRFWVVGGYADGASCAYTYAAVMPDVWKVLLSVSGDAYPGSGDPDGVRDTVYGGDAEAFAATRPVRVLMAHKGEYSESSAVFTAGGADREGVTTQKRSAAAATVAGMSTAYLEVAGAGRGVDALVGGLDRGLDLLYPILGLREPL